MSDATIFIDGAGMTSAIDGQACLVVIYGKGIGRRFTLDKEEVSIGRSESADIQVDNESVSRQHAKIVTEDGVSRLLDMGSTNGTFINSRLEYNRSLSDGDLLRVGQTTFKYLSGSSIETKYHEEIYRLTTVDGLTQAFNKRYFLEAMKDELKRALRYNRAMSLLMFDIDHFKKINDAHGHLAGDFVLRELACIVSQNIRGDDVFARYGGEEFAIILPEIDNAGLVRVAEKLRKLIEEWKFTYDGQIIPVTSSFGGRSIDQDDTEADLKKFIADADDKLYQAKRSGRNRVCA